MKRGRDEGKGKKSKKNNMLRGGREKEEIRKEGEAGSKTRSGTERKRKRELQMYVSNI